ncbi:MAG: glycosyltransferase [Spirochaetaceae bacterium]|nr:glycosyltransferase [Spirochaetaceae bacterium]
MDKDLIMPVVSVIMSVYNEPESILRSAVESILKQTFRDFEFIIVMDSPENETNKGILSEYSKADDRINLLFNEENEGLTFSLNKALQHAKGKYIARMDADDVSLPLRLELQNEWLEKNNLDFIGGYVQTISQAGQIINNCIKVPVDNSRIRKKMLVNNCVFHPSWFLKKSVFDHIGAYDTKYVEDYDFILKAMKKGYVFGNIPQVVLQYRMSADSISRSSLFVQYLRMRWLQKTYCGKLKDVTIEDYVNKYYSEKNAAKFSASNRSLTLALQNIHEKKFVSAFMKLIHAFFNSKFYAEKMLRYFFSFQ